MPELGDIREFIFGHKEVTFNNGVKMVSKLNGEPTILLKKDNDVILDLSTFAPEGTIIKYNPKIEWNATDISRNNPPQISMGRINGVNSIFDFLHECGHLQEKDLSNAAIDSVRTYAEKYFYQPTENAGPDRFAALSERDKSQILSERMAWAYALKSVRNIEKQFGVNIVEKMGGAKGIIDYINHCLSEYQNHTKTELEFLGFEPFTRKMVLDILESQSVEANS